jgi:hypothetical protein
MALLTGVAAGVGSFLHGDGSFQAVTNVPGEYSKKSTTGVDVYQTVRVVADGMGWDIFPLIFAVPA